MTLPIPAEWTPHRAMWVGWPSHPELWFEYFDQAQSEVEGLVRALAGAGKENVKLMVGNEEALPAARARFEGVNGVEVVAARFGDIWLRDTGPIFTAGSEVANAFGFNGWGEKFVYQYDDQVADQIAEIANAPVTRHNFIMEGGALDHDGEGTILTTGQCLLNPNRNTGWTKEEAEKALAESVGAKVVIWLGDGLLNDHTDGHVDNLARFVAPGVVACPIAFGEDDPNAGVYDETARILANSVDAAGRKIKVVRIPSPGLVLNDEEQPVPASHMNFLIANGAIVVPTYGNETAGRLAGEALQSVFPDHEIVLSPSNAVLTGGGSFHCISQQEPA